LGIRCRAFAGSIGTLPSSFTSVIRLLMNDYFKEPQALSQIGRFLAGRLLKSPVQAPDASSPSVFLNPRALRIRTKLSLCVISSTTAFRGYEHLFTLTIFLHRHCKGLCDASLNPSHSTPSQIGLNFGWLIGNAIPSIGGGAGFLLGGFRFYGFLPLIKHDAEGFRRYWHTLKTRTCG